MSANCNVAASRRRRVSASRRRRVSFVAACALALAGCARRPADFSGTWTLDKQTSKGLPHSFERVDSYSMIVRQTNDSITMTISFTGRDITNTIGPSTYPLNGAQTFVHDTLRRSDTWRQIERSEDKRHLVILTKQIQNFGPQVTFIQDTSLWSLPSADRLQIESHVAGVPGVQVRVFARSH